MNASNATNIGTSTIATRQYQMFPVLSPAQIETAQRFASGPARQFAPGESVYEIGELGVPSWLVLAGGIDVVRRDGLSDEATIVTHGPGQFSGEVSQLAGRASLAAGRASSEGCTAVPFDAAHLRALMVGSADVGETVMRAFILRRVALIEEGGAGSILIGDPESAAMMRLQGFLTRSGFPNMALDASTEGEGRALVERLGLLPDELPLMVCPNGQMLRNPTNAQAAACLGITPELDPDAVYDVAIIGAGPAGLAASVYAASEGLSVLVLDERAFGGQAGASARIENYLGFPTGISGQALAGRAFNQALKFGAEVAIPLRAAMLNCGADDGQLHRLALDDKRDVRARTVVIASGARYRRPDIANLEQYEGSSISYWATPIEAQLCAGEEIALVGGGNSAGQAVVFLAPKVERLHLIVRRPLEDTMSKYLIERIAALPNVEIHVGSEIVGIEGDEKGRLAACTIRQRRTGAEKVCALHHIFLFIGADPNSAWLDGCVALDDKGFVVTGAACQSQGDGRAVLPLETSMPGVFAIGDIRAGSTKRVAAAVGEGAAVVAQIHAALAATDSARERADA
ncbi:FAD-dependent oxidoreductase [Sphingobium nicotianae]|uniref:Thioredoxin reductase n=1 Tax=Sphingobium nicotianae TaxID=2782607 RepID=A0A9X1DB19_9SPHN|nr:FAD-dependent oxidoreductase [Sphingobium nicotianae]MBT2186654.1 FAD-dependent oxidoreductase [Sphingobium nicotianae]